MKEEMTFNKLQELLFASWECEDDTNIVDWEKYAKFCKKVNATHREESWKLKNWKHAKKKL